MVNPTTSKDNSTQRSNQRLPAGIRSQKNTKTQQTLNGLSSSVPPSSITLIHKKKPDQTYSVGKGYKKTLRDNKGPQKEKLAQRAGKKCFIIIVIITKTTTGRETLSETKSLLGAPQHCNVPDNAKKTFPRNFFLHCNTPENTRRQS